MMDNEGISGFCISDVFRKTHKVSKVWKRMFEMSSIVYLYNVLWEVFVTKFKKNVKK